MLDLNILRQLMNYDETAVQRFLSIAKEQLPLQLIEIQSFIIQKDYDNLSITAHAMKGMLGYLGASSTVNLAEALESLADNKADWAEITSKFEVLESTIKGLLKDL